MAPQIKVGLINYATIICRISIEVNDAEFSIGQKVQINNWEINIKKVIRSENSKKINAQLNRIISVLEVNFTVLKTKYELMLKNSYKKITIERK